MLLTRTENQAEAHLPLSVTWTPSSQRGSRKAEQVPYVVAPYEADAQLAYLEKEGIVDGIITEDSDLLVFGCKNVRSAFRRSHMREWCS